MNNLEAALADEAFMQNEILPTKDSITQNLQFIKLNDIQVNRSTVRGIDVNGLRNYSLMERGSYAYKAQF